MQVVLFNHISWVDSLVLMRMFAPSGVAKVPSCLLLALGQDSSRQMPNCQRFDRRLLW